MDRRSLVIGLAAAGLSSAAGAKPRTDARPSPTEILRVFASPGMPQDIYVATFWKDPAAWGLLLADVARQAAREYSQQGVSEAEALNRIAEVLLSELAAPIGTSTS